MEMLRQNYDFPKQLKKPSTILNPWSSHFMTAKENQKMPRSRSELMERLIDDVSHLARYYEHRESMDNGKTHVSRHSGLIEQLYEDIYEASSGPEGESVSKSILASSKAPIADDMLGLLVTAAQISVNLSVMAGGNVFSDIKENFYQLPNLLINATDELVEHVSDQVHTFRNEAELKLTWKDKPRRIKGFCPACGQKNAIIVSMDSHGPISAKCTKCEAVWGKETMGVLAGSLHETPKKQSPDNLT
jgi:hypothetical protein